MKRMLGFLEFEDEWESGKGFEESDVLVSATLQPSNAEAAPTPAV
jgi:hypothetical protein